ncbi:hypothetical protein L3Y34_019223 [Caenorhabditis briggsae]|uniref:Uncharacterized protein n=1 Tax=Caenorhabditis briggsae TaxID=6238 RepID=A0AAE9DPF2_CAEBR|nr:hypothetical protein L3Y34_019223 [Caenorhabditis briggsae]
MAHHSLPCHGCNLYNFELFRHLLTPGSLQKSIEISIFLAGLSGNLLNNRYPFKFPMATCTIVPHIGWLLAGIFGELDSISLFYANCQCACNFSIEFSGDLFYEKASSRCFGPGNSQISRNFN